MQGKVIDIHCHIIPGIDDGPKSGEESLEMVRQAVDQGVRGIVATPHYIPGEIEYEKDFVLDKVKALQGQIDKEGLDCKIYSGMELYLMPELIRHFDAEKILPLGDSQYVLVEFPAREVSPSLIDLLREIRIRGYFPILAHPERNMAIIENPILINELLDLEILLQINAGSITGSGGKKVQKLAMEFIKQGLVHFVASDAHSTSRRKCKLADAISSLKQEKLTDVSQTIFCDNGHDLLNSNRLSTINNYYKNVPKIKKILGSLINR